MLQIFGLHFFTVFVKLGSKEVLAENFKNDDDDDDDGYGDDDNSILIS
jgi:hypothetical protein